MKKFQSIPTLQIQHKVSGQILAKVSQRLMGADLRGKCLAGALLVGANLEGADLRGVDLSGADLRNANLAEANLAGACLVKARLDGANLDGVDLRNANLERANLFCASLRGAHLRETSLVDAVLRSADFEGATLLQCDLSNADLCGANLGNVFLRHCNLAGATLSGARLTRAVIDPPDCLDRTDLTGSDYHRGLDVSLKDFNRAKPSADPARKNAAEHSRSKPKVAKPLPPGEEPGVDRKNASPSDYRPKGTRHYRAVRGAARCAGAKGFTLVEILIVVLIMAVLLAIAIPGWRHSRLITQQKACQEILSKIHGAKQQWALEQHKTSDDPIVTSDLVSGGGGGYLRIALRCPSSGSYSLGTLNQKPTCSITAPYDHNHTPGSLATGELLNDSGNGNGNGNGNGRGNGNGNRNGSGRGRGNGNGNSNRNR